MKTEVLSTDTILLLSGKIQEQLRTELGNLFHSAFPKMPEGECNYCVSEYFRRPGGTFGRVTILMRNEIGKLIATSIFDYGQMTYGNRMMKGIYINNRVVLPEYQGFGLGQTMATKILMEWQPEVLLTTCAQSSSLHSWLGLLKKGVITGFEVYPRIEHGKEKDIIITVPYKDLDFVIHVFKQMYFAVFEGNQERVDTAIRNLTVLLVRKNIHEKIYDFNPWQKSGREDKLAKALGLTEKDGVLVMFRKNHKELV